MSRSDPSVSLRLPSEVEAQVDVRPADGRPRLRLVVTRGALGVELEAPYELGPIAITSLSATFPDVKFPVELSGGIGNFRHRRGRLVSIAIALSTVPTGRWARQQLRRVLGTDVEQVLVAPSEDGAIVGLATAGGALAFEVVCAPTGDDLRFMATEARALGLALPPQVLAVQALGAMLRPHGEAVGGAIVVKGVTGRIVRELMPHAGMRAPATRGMTWKALAYDAQGVTVSAEETATPIALSSRAVRALEGQTLVADAEVAALKGQTDDARSRYLEALARAPRHPEIARRLAELDRAAGGRTEAALSTLTEAMTPMEAGLLGASLLAAHGDRDGARVAYRRAAEAEAYGVLAAMSWLEAARLEDDAEAALECLDEAVARAPGLAGARWARIGQLLRRGDAETARADVEHLEAAARGGRARHEVWKRFGEQLLTHRHLGLARDAFERALRYAPDDVETVAGLARALALVDERRRALDLLSRAVGLAAKRRERADRVVVELAAALAEVADDRPAAIAHVRGLEADSPVVFEARALEARWCAELGDLAGADRAGARLQEAVEAALGALVAVETTSDRRWGRSDSAYATREDARAAIAMHLWEVARIQQLDRRDLARARQLLALAMRLAPQHRGIRDAFRRVASDLDERRAPEPMATSRDEDPATPPRRELRRTDVPMPLTQRNTPVIGSEPQPSISEAVTHPIPSSAPSPVTHVGLGVPTAMLPEDDEPLLDDDDEADLELRVEQLTAQLRADPARADFAEELSGILERLGRDHDLLALVSGRIDDYGSTPALDTYRRGALTRLRDQATAEGRADEAQLYAMMIDQET